MDIVDVLEMLTGILAHVLVDTNIFIYLICLTHYFLFHYMIARVACCEVEEGDDLHIGTAAYEGSSQTTYSCVSGVRSQYEVHVISNYESNGQHGFGQTRTTGITDVNLNVDGNGSIPLVLVFVSYEPVNWILQIPSGVVIDTVMLVSQ